MPRAARLCAPYPSPALSPVEIRLRIHQCVLLEKK